MPVASGMSCYRALVPSLPFGARDPEVTPDGARSLGFHAGLAINPPPQKSWDTSGISNFSPRRIKTGTVNVRLAWG